MPYGRAGGFIQNPHGGAEKKVNFFSANFDVTVKYWKKGSTLTASRSREDVFWQISLRRDRQDARQISGGWARVELRSH